MIRESSWKLSRLRIIDLGYIPERYPVLLADGEIAQLRGIAADFASKWMIFDTDSFDWLEIDDIELSRVIGIILPSWAETVEALESEIIDRMIDSFRDRDRPYHIRANSDHSLEDIRRLQQEAKRRYRDG